MPAVFVALVAASFGLRHYRTAHAPTDQEIEANVFRAKYGPQHFSEGIEEWLVRDYFADRRGGTFLDVGAGHYQEKSNSYYLESELGWTGVAVDPVVELEAGYLAHRPKTRFRPFFVSDVSDAQAQLWMLRSEQSNVSSGDKTFTSRFGSPTARTVPTITLSDLLDREHVTQLDFVSMDIELWEPKALAGFDITRFHPALVCIEAHPEVRQQILAYFQAHDYAIVGKYLRADPENLYFAPAR